jgi:hypothetical protein
LVSGELDHHLSHVGLLQDVRAAGALERVGEQQVIGMRHFGAIRKKTGIL